jgi:DnaJ-class molecular chaperone
MVPKPLPKQPTDDGSGIYSHETVICPTCRGTGYRLWGYAFDAKCTTCRGTGWTTATVIDQMRRMSAS